MMNKFITKGIENIFRMSGAVTSIVIFFIIIFLFKEGSGLFKTTAMESGYALYVPSQNPVNVLSTQQIKEIFDSEITSWAEVGGNEEDIRLYRIDDIFNEYAEEEFGEDYQLLPEKLTEVIREDASIIAFLPTQYAPKGEGIKELPVEKNTLSSFLNGKEWLPTATPSPFFGAMPLLLGTLLVSILAIIMALPLGLGVAIYLAELAGNRTRKIMKPIVELLAGIPSVVYGFFGLVVVAPAVQKLFDLPVGETAFTGSIVLAIMALPTIISVAEDALSNTPRAMKEASLALGATHWQTIYGVVIPYAKSGIMAAVVLGIGRAIGETMAVLMVTGNAAVMPHSIFESVRTIPATIAAELGEAPTGGMHYQALFLLGCILFLITLLISIISEMITRKQTAKSH